MIDFHNHIIPNLDDGSKSIEMSINMIKEAYAQGITDIVNTVHYQHPKMEKKDTSYEFIINEINKFQKIAYDNNIHIKIHPASEVFFKFNLTEILDNPITTFGNGKYMLIEFQRLSFPKGYENEIFKIQLKGITPIIAHPERYRGIQKNINLAKEWIDRGYLIQIDCSSIIGGFGKETQKSAIDLLENGYCHLIGSDAHNDKNRNFLLKDTLKAIEDIIGKNSSLIILNNSKKVLNGADVAKFQKRNSRELLPEEQYNSPHPNPMNSYGKTYGEHREFLEFSKQQHKDLMDYCNSIDIQYSTSVWDVTSAKEISDLNPKLIEVPSASNTHYQMLEILRDEYKGDIHVSFGMTTKNEQEKLVTFFEEKKQAKERLIVYSCTSGYPVPFEDVCLLEILKIKDQFSTKVKDIAFSGHHLGISIDIAAYVLGASWIERHFTMDRTWKGTDHSASLEPTGFSKLTRDLKATYKTLNYKNKEILDIEQPQRDKLKFYK